MTPGLGFAAFMHQHEDVETLRISYKIFGSIPNFSPNDIPSLHATI
jgi:hypothetical protein